MIVFPALIVAVILLAAAAYLRETVGLVLVVLGVIVLLGSFTYRPVFYPMFYGYHYYARPGIVVAPGYGRPMYGRPMYTRTMYGRPGYR